MSPPLLGVEYLFWGSTFIHLAFEKGDIRATSADVKGIASSDVCRVTPPGVGRLDGNRYPQDTLLLPVIRRHKTL